MAATIAINDEFSHQFKGKTMAQEILGNVFEPTINSGSDINNQMWRSRGIMMHGLFIISFLMVFLNVQSVKAEIRDVIYAALDDGTVYLCKPLPISKAEKEAGESQCKRLNSLGYKISAMVLGGGVLYVGDEKGYIWTCKPEVPDQCVYMNKFGSGVASLAYSGNRLFAGTKAGTMLSCDLSKIDGCGDLNYLGSAINVMEISDDYIYAGMSSGNLVQCWSKASHFCTSISDKTGSGSITAIKKVGSHIYVANNEIMRCHYNKRNTCESFFKPGKVSSSTSYYFSNIESVKNKIIASYSVRKSRVECLDSCYTYRYWDQSQLVACPADGNPDTHCNKVLTAKGQQRTFELGRANGPNFYYSIGKKVWFLPFSSETATTDGEFNSEVSKLLYVER